MAPPEKLLETLNGHDYDMFVEHLQPELAKAKRTIAGKQVQAVSASIYQFWKRANSTTRLRKKYTETTGMIRQI